jgi:hypothetical protein
MAFLIGTERTFVQNPLREANLHFPHTLVSAISIAAIG